MLNPALAKFPDRPYTDLHTLIFEKHNGLYYLNARWYDPELGRFITEDPARDGENWYGYCRQNPVNFTDPWGLCPSSDAQAAKLAGQAIVANGGASYGMPSQYLNKPISPNNDKKTSDQIYTFGFGGNYTLMGTSMGLSAGVYVNPKNDALFLATTALSMTPISLNPAFKVVESVVNSINTEDVGLYVDASAGSGFGSNSFWNLGSSASAVVSIGTFKSLNDAKGPYLEAGGSLSAAGKTAGFDIYSTTSGKAIGGSISTGFGIGTSVLEAHAKFGVTGFLSLKK